jgi:pimeloyl-ACP methyl ester carboxylesterase
VSRRLHEIKFCNACGRQVVFRIPEGDNFPRAVCEACGTIQYQNPKVVVGSIPEWEGRILLCRRAIEPRHGLWTLPAGFIGGTHSEVVRRVGMSLMRGARFLKRRVPGGHLFPFEHPREAAAAVDELLRELDA